MAVPKMRQSDASGQTFELPNGARVRVLWNDRTKVDLRADLTDAEVRKLLPWAKPVVIRPDRRNE
jgi:hypothetical protein